MKSIHFCIPVLAIVSILYPQVAYAQRANPSADRPKQNKQLSAGPSSPSDLAAEIAELRDHVAKLETALAKLAPQSSDEAGLAPAAETAARPAANPVQGAVAAKYRNCLGCHETRPSSELPPSHLEVAASGVVSSAAPVAGASPAPMAGMGGKKKVMGGGMGGKGVGGGSKPDAGMGGMGMEDDAMEMAGMGAGGTAAGGGAAMAPADDDSMKQMMKMMERMQMMKMMQMMEKSMVTGGTSTVGGAAMAPTDDDSMKQMMKMMERMQMMKMMQMMEKSMVTGGTGTGAAMSGNGAPAVGAPPMMDDM